MWKNGGSLRDIAGAFADKGPPVTQTRQVVVVSSGMWKNGGSLRDIAGAFAEAGPPVTRMSGACSL